MTRGVFGIRKNGTDKLNYSNSDSFPWSLGKDVLLFISRHTIEELNRYYDNAVTEETENDVTTEIDDWTLNDIFCMDTVDGFIQNSLFCEYGYIINLDDSVLEVWKGFQKEPDDNNRYGTQQKNGYYPCKCVMKIDLKDISEETAESYVTAMGNLK